MKTSGMFLNPRYLKVTSYLVGFFSFKQFNSYFKVGLSDINTGFFMKYRLHSTTWDQAIDHEKWGRTSSEGPYYKVGL
jgi:hypothetical protein